MLSMLTLGAIFDGDTIWILIPLTALMIPIIAILIHHQQKMAQIIHGRGISPELENEIRALRAEVQQLRQMMGMQAPRMQDYPDPAISIMPPPGEPMGMRQGVQI